jgi:hypothetical protein
MRFQPPGPGRAPSGIAVNAQLRADETRLRQKAQGDVLDRLLALMERKKRELGLPDAAGATGGDAPNTRPARRR